MNTDANDDNFMVGKINVSPQHNTISMGEHTCRLQPKVMAVLHYLANNKDRVINNDELLEHVWQGRIVTHSSIQKCVNALRSAFAEFDANFDYVVYFSKRGYQLITPVNEENSSDDKKTFWHRPTIYIEALVLLIIIGLYLLSTYPLTINSVTKSATIPAYTQVKPYVSNTGREQLIEPHINSDRVAFIREEKSQTGTANISQLFIQSTSGQQWKLSSARGAFTTLSWSESGRNLVVVEQHSTTNIKSASSEQQGSVGYYTFHIYTLDFKAEKVIEKNVLSHWQGVVSSVSWWDESTLEFTASHGIQFQRTRHLYTIADQNLSIIKTPSTQGKLLYSQVLNKKTATLSVIKAEEYVQFLDEDQKLISQWAIPFSSASISWLADGKGILLLSAENQLSILNIDGKLQPVEYYPKVNSYIKQARSKDNGSSIILTVKTPSNSKTNSIDEGANLAPERFMEKGGGFIYSAPLLK